jgi:pimeloyl-ACP methyl ester carboxylesterase
VLIPLTRLALKALPDATGFTITRSLAAVTQRPQVTDAERAALASANRMQYGDGNVAWAWGGGPPVVLVHGWSGRAAQMAPLAARISEYGFRAIAMDVSGHGDSPGRRTEWGYFLRDIPALSDTLGEEVYAYVGHSAGALTVAAARRAGRISARSYVLVCAPTHPSPAIDQIRRKLAPRPGVVARYQRFVAGQFGAPWDALTDGWAYRGLGDETLLISDTTDRFVDHADADRIAAVARGARIVKTDRYGHARILTSPELLQEVCAFLRIAASGGR